MKGRQLAILLALLVAVGAVALFFNRRHEASWSNTATASGGKVLDFSLNDVAHVTIKSGAAELNVLKKNDTWTVKERADYPADFEKVSGLLRKLWELRPVQDVKIGPSQFARLELADPSVASGSGTVVDLKDASDKRLAGLLVGKKFLKNSPQMPGEGGGFPVGRYVMPQDSAKHVFLVSDTLEEVDPKPEHWLAHDFIKVENPKSIALAGADPAMSWSIVRDNASAPWKFADAKPGEEVDGMKASSMATVLASGAFNDVLAPDAAVAETGLDKPSTARIGTFDGFSYELRIGKPTGENYPVTLAVKADLPKERAATPNEKPEDKGKLDQEFQTKQKQLTEKLAREQKLQDRPFLIAKSTIDELLMNRASLVAPPPTSPSPATGAAPSAPVAVPPPKVPMPGQRPIPPTPPPSRP
jgi:hypothetical protein